MTDPSKIKPSHTARKAFIYIRQSSLSQVEHNRESTARQYALADNAQQLGWPKDQVTIVDEDLGLSGATADKRSGFARMISEVALGQHSAITCGRLGCRMARHLPPNNRSRLDADRQEAAHAVPRASPGYSCRNYQQNLDAFRRRSPDSLRAVVTDRRTSALSWPEDF